MISGRINAMKMKNNKLSKTQRILVLISGLALVVVIFVPLWQIDFGAPQYPEGLTMIMYPNGLSGDVDIINGLNHYIGMRTLHTADFVEFTILPYLIAFFALFCLAVFAINRKGGLTGLFWAFTIFGIIAMFDFYRWEYNYGHNLDPSAPIRIPGMAYTPPLIGYKQLLNFEVYSVPHVGGSLFFAVGILLLLAYTLPFIQKKREKMRTNKKVLTAAAFIGMLFLAGCSSGPKPLRLGQDACDFCKMSIANKNFGAEIITNKGKVYKFDDTHCLAAFRAEKIDSNTIKDVYLVNYAEPHNFIRATDAILVTGEDLHSPMGGNTAAFDKEAEASATQSQVKGQRITLQELFNNR